uniref:Protein kinase domain-containing protein n=1 Tax=Setaria digitata TaxID=48799 RepID=A0A915PWK2_9BILA
MGKDCTESLENINALKRFSISSSTGLSCSAVTNVEYTTPLDSSYYRLNSHSVAGYWKLYSAKSITDDKESTVFAFDRKNNIKAPSRLGRGNRLTLIDLIRYEVSQLASLVHPRILQVLHDLEEDKEVIAFASEHVRASLEVVVMEGGLDRIEIKLGILQLIDGLSYLHNSAKILHGNLIPNVIYITLSRNWKIAGFAFSVAACEPNLFPCFPWTKKLPVHLQPDLDFLAPEYLVPNQNTVTSAADVFSLGVLICWICAGGKRLIDAKNNIETYNVICGQLDTALKCIAEDLGPNLLDAMEKVLSLDVARRPTVQFLALIKYFDDPALSTLRQLDDIMQVFDPEQKNSFLSQTLYDSLPIIPENLWFARVLPRFDEFFIGSYDLYAALSRSLFHMLNHCESHNIDRLRPWIHRIVDHAIQRAVRLLILGQRQLLFFALTPLVVENMNVLFRRLSDEEVEDQVQDLIVMCIKSQDVHIQGKVIRNIPLIAEFLPSWFLSNRLIPSFNYFSMYVNGDISRQLDFLACIGALSDRCDSNVLNKLIATISICNVQNSAVINAISRLVQRILMYDATRLRDRAMICTYLLNPLTLGLASNDLSTTHFEELINTIRILIDIIEHLRNTASDKDSTHKNSLSSFGRMNNRLVSMSSSHLPLVMITAARPSCSSCGYDSSLRKISFLSADGRLEDRPTSSKSSLESNLSLKFGNNSDVSDEQQSSSLRETRRQSLLDTDIAHFFDQAIVNKMNHERKRYKSERRSRTRSPEVDEVRLMGRPSRPNSFTNLGHNLVGELISCNENNF